MDKPVGVDDKSEATTPLPQNASRVRNLILRLLASVLLIALVFQFVPAAEIAATLRTFDLRWIAPIVALHLLGVVVRSAKLYFLSAAAGVPISFLSIVRIYFIGNFAYAFVPSLEAAHVGLLGYEKGRYTRAALSVSMDRLSGLVALFGIGALALSLRTGANSALHPMIPILVVSVFAASLALLVAGFSTRIRDGLWKCLPDRLRAGDHAIARSLAALRDGLRLVSERKSRLPTLLALSVLFQAIALVSYGLAARAMVLEVDPIELATVFPLMGLANLVPAFLGIGTRDLGFVLALAQIDLQAASAVAISFVHLGLVLYSAAIGAVLLAFRGSRLWPERNPR